SDVPVYVSGESGSGKELCARAIHVHGPRGDAPFVAENCAAIPESLFESELFGHKRGSFTGATADRTGLFRLADGGTLFLDEIGELPLPLQAKLLRVLQEQQVRPIGAREPVAVDVRIITASNRDLADRVRRGQFREDLYHRIHVIEIPVPPLRRRIEDLPLLTDHILGRIGNGEPLSLSPAALDLLSRYEWPGNVRELENELLRAATLAPGLDGDEIGPEAFSESVRAAQGSLSARFRGQTLKDAVKEATREVERELVTEALRREKGNKSAAARRLGVSRPTLDAKMESLKIPRYPA
ncbi:MAG: sigma-54 interaction domain-containing protein, partial [Planctomycetota bacterium]